ncbi:Malic enzyme [Venustampulla echinocandica]|uniref:Malic enzyme n=1 Tax=Venustampulla echinocandica TaxID=2656787 RepID=A0A370TI23_9HELO|nr:Malic enzyme [Venustampulla echinocandica]RDL35006.1 Malic enzyme [Venustampulla echinocandica]
MATIVNPSSRGYTQKRHTTDIWILHIQLQQGEPEEHMGLFLPMLKAMSFKPKDVRLKQLESKTSPIEKYIYLSNLRNSNVHLFYRLVLENFTTLTPLIYTPVVGEACLKWSDIYQQPEGLYLSYKDRGSLRDILRNWPQPNVAMTVVTDGSRILGLGDLGVNGMGIPVGKLALYTGCAGIRPEATLPLTLDLGTNNETLLNDPLYMGSRMKRVSEDEERMFLDELMVALNETWPGIVVQFEDFKSPFPALERYQYKYSCFNDDVQGTGAVILAGIITALKMSGIPVKDQRAVFMGAGSAGTGVAQQIVQYFMKEGLTEDEARRCFWFVDTKGLITNDRGDKLAQHKLYFSRDDNSGQQFKSLTEVVDYVKPTILMGLSTIRGIFDEPILKKMTSLNRHPIIFPLSNPSSKAECTFEEAMKFTDGRAIFASGSPFPTHVHNGKVMYPSQGNNMYVFPGIGLGSILCKTKHISQEMIYTSAVALSKTVIPSEFANGMLYPSLDRIRPVSVIVAREVIRQAQREGLDREPSLRDMNDETLDQWINEQMYNPHKEGRFNELERESTITDDAEAPFYEKERLSAKL